MVSTAEVRASLHLRHDVKINSTLTVEAQVNCTTWPYQCSSHARSSLSSVGGGSVSRIQVQGLRDSGFSVFLSDLRFA